ncbi:hypothetical protein PLICRDRAFT_471509 [Plicaturopsis crispa FD-325 SS-3]|nr:hypothetical protein PLICRDRAFT_471509 [Plicaturopsis crispa FD-325 SS-3]
MAQVAAMGPPLSPRETRRSGRRSAPSASASTSKSPVSPSSEPGTGIRQTKDDASSSHSSNNNNNTTTAASATTTRKPRRASLSTSNGSGRNARRFKQEDVDEGVGDTRENVAAPPATNGRSKRKGKEKERGGVGAVDVTLASPSTHPDGATAPDDGEDEQGITRCVCGSTEDDPDAGEFMVQCESCNAWQHGLCMGYEAEDQLPDDDYHCEQCRPDLHQELLRKLSKRGRHSSANSHRESVVNAATTMSRSHSPSHASKQPAKRRNTMNSRDAAFDESLKEIIEATAAEAHVFEPRGNPISGSVNGHELDEETEGGRKKRRRVDEDAVPKKRTRSQSNASEQPHISTNIDLEETHVNGNGNSAKASPSVPPPARPAGGRKARGGGRKSAVAQETSNAPDGDADPGLPAKRSHNGRAKAAQAARRPPASHVSNAQQTATAAEASRAYRNSHAYAVSQQPLYTSWNLPDYLLHLQPMLPSDVPQPLEVRASESGEVSVERGVKVKWPSKRMSVGDMNKRVRTLVEWVGREQAGALERGRRKEALEKVLKESTNGSDPMPAESGSHADSTRNDLEPERNDTHMVVDGQPLVDSPTSENKPPLSGSSESLTMTMMEDLMQELIVFQERFGPGVKTRERERRPTA